MRWTLILIFHPRTSESSDLHLLSPLCFDSLILIKFFFWVTLIYSSSSSTWSPGRRWKESIFMQESPLSSSLVSLEEVSISTDKFVVNGSCSVGLQSLKIIVKTVKSRSLVDSDTWLKSRSLSFITLNGKRIFNRSPKRIVSSLDRSWSCPYTTWSRFRYVQVMIRILEFCYIVKFSHYDT